MATGVAILRIFYDICTFLFPLKHFFKVFEDINNTYSYNSFE